MTSAISNITNIAYGLGGAARKGAYTALNQGQGDRSVGNPGGDLPPGFPPGNPLTTSNYGFGGSYGSYKSPEDVQEEQQAAINNLIDAAFGGIGRLGDIDKEAVNAFKNIDDRAEDARKSFKANTQIANMVSEWQPNQQKETSTYRAIKNRLGNGAYSSSIADLNEGMARVDDMNDVQTINTWKENIANIYDNLRNTLSSLASDKAELMNSVDDERSKLINSTWSAISNINPLLGTEENFKKAMNGQTVSTGSGTEKYSLKGFSTEKPDALKALMVDLEVPNAFNPLTGKYVRPDRAVNEANRIGNTGKANKASIAHREFGNEMDAYKRRV